MSSYHFTLVGLLFTLFIAHANEPQHNTQNRGSLTLAERKSQAEEMLKSTHTVGEPARSPASFSAVSSSTDSHSYPTSSPATDYFQSNQQSKIGIRF